MERIGRHGIWYPTHQLPPNALRAFVAKIESLNYATLWYPESTGYESMTQAMLMLMSTESLVIGSSIASIYARDAFSTRQAQDLLNQVSGDRFVLGLGVSHAPMVERMRGHSYGKPLTAMREYLDALEGDQYDLTDGDDRPVVIAALGPKMLELAGERTCGAIPYNVTPEHTERAREILGGDRRLAVEQKICLETDADKARTHARAELKRYLGLPNYRNNWLSLGFEESDFESGGTDRFIDAMVAWGDEDAIRDRIKAHFDAGADHVAIHPVHGEGDGAALVGMLETFAPE